MLNKLDDAIAPNICQHLLFAICIIQLIFFWNFINTSFFYPLTIVLIITIFFSTKVFLVRYERKRVYLIVKNRILKKGYDKSIFNGKCVSICQLTQATYIAFRYKSISDFSYFFHEHRKKIPQYIMEDEDLENILNNIDFNKVKEGQVIHEFTN
jgi:hypothetical protein